jgi:hypothetical protein
MRAWLGARRAQAHSAAVAPSRGLAIALLSDMRNRLLLSTCLAFAAFSSFAGCIVRGRHHHDTVIVEEHHHRRW